MSFVLLFVLFPVFFFFNDTATTEIYTLSLHDALPILPRPQFALVSIELGLICRFSTKEGVLWIQAQLTDNSWLLFPEIRLTGGFAFVSWFKGPNRGQFVLTMGGFHPDFHRDGYPTVPRLGFVVDLGFISIKGENYFALTSEAVMAGGRLEGS